MLHYAVVETTISIVTVSIWSLLAFLWTAKRVGLHRWLLSFDILLPEMHVQSHLILTHHSSQTHTHTLSLTPPPMNASQIITTSKSCLDWTSCPPLSLSFSLSFRLIDLTVVKLPFQLNMQAAFLNLPMKHDLLTNRAYPRVHCADVRS